MVETVLLHEEISEEEKDLSSKKIQINLKKYQWGSGLGSLFGQQK